MRVDPARGSRRVALTIGDVYQVLGQEGLLGLALHPRLLRGSNYIYVMYTYDADPGPDAERRAKIRRYTYYPVAQKLGDPVDLTGLPHGPDHGASRLVFGPDGKLYASRGDHGSNFLAYHCVANRAQELPAAADIQRATGGATRARSCAIDLDGSIPDDNPVLNGVRSHVFSYGHRNPQGMAFGPDARLYESEHGQDTDDEVNLIEAGRNYGWPRSPVTRTISITPTRIGPRRRRHLARTSSTATTFRAKCRARRSPTSSSRPRVAARDFLHGAEHVRSARAWQCDGGPAGLEVYTSPAIPGWNPSILVAGMTSGVIFRMPLRAGADQAITYFKGERYRDLAIAPDGRRIYAITDARPHR